MATEDPNQLSLLPDTLPAWPNIQRGVPNALARSALFCVGKRGERRYYNKEVVAAAKGTELVYTGSELRQDDLDVFLQVLHLAKEQKLGENIKFTARSMIVALQWQTHSDSYERLSDAMNRMKATAIRLTVENQTGGRISYTGSLMGEFTWRETGSNEPLREWTVSLEKNIVKLFAPDAYSLLNWQSRLDLAPLAKFLHSYYSTHKEPFPVKVETLHKLTNSGVKELYKFRYSLKKALAALVDSGFFLDARIDPKSDLVYVERKADIKLIQ